MDFTKELTNCYDTPRIEENGTLTKCEWTLGYVYLSQRMLLWLMWTSCTQLLGVSSTFKLLSSGFVNLFWASCGPHELSLFHFLGNWGSKISWLS